MTDTFFGERTFLKYRQEFNTLKSIYKLTDDDSDLYLFFLAENEDKLNEKETEFFKMYRDLLTEQEQTKYQSAREQMKIYEPPVKVMGEFGYCHSEEKPEYNWDYLNRGFNCYEEKPDYEFIHKWNKR